jgi:hypothetical protein
VIYYLFMVRIWKLGAQPFVEVFWGMTRSLSRKHVPKVTLHRTLVQQPEPLLTHHFNG